MNTPSVDFQTTLLDKPDPEYRKLIESRLNQASNQGRLAAVRYYRALLKAIDQGKEPCPAN